MSMARHEPIPLPPQGALETVPESSDTVFNWDYEVGRDSLLNLYEKGKRLQWNASTDIDWSIDVDPERFPDFLPPEQVNALLNPPEKLPFAFPVNPHLHTLLAQIIREPRWDMTYLGMQIMVEGLALAAFGLMNFMNPQEPLIQQITGYVIRDEARHVAFGVLSLEE